MRKTKERNNGKKIERLEKRNIEWKKKERMNRKKERKIEKRKKEQKR